VNDPLAENLNDIHDVEKIMPGFLKVMLSSIYFNWTKCAFLWKSKRSRSRKELHHFAEPNLQSGASPAAIL
jgi:hypothetical protein